MKNNIFQFKQFRINQSKSAMKIGTDGVLLGAWTPITKNPLKVLDVGSGTGLIALMLAQRLPEAKVVGVEIDENAAFEAADNFKNSPWSSRLKLVHDQFQFFAQKSEQTFDLIASNPPFFKTPIEQSKSSRTAARNNYYLPYEDLFAGVKKLLSDQGEFTLICPFEYRNNLIELGLSNALHLSQELCVKGSQTSSFKRILMCFSKVKTNLKTQELVLEKKRHERTEAYQNLVSDYYL